MSDMTVETVQARIAGLDDETQKKMVCALVGHSKIVEMCIGYVHCARCGAQIGDTLSGIWDAETAVIVGHDCVTCHKNFAALDWCHTFKAPWPFEREQPVESEGGEA